MAINKKGFAKATLISMFASLNGIPAFCESSSATTGTNESGNNTQRKAVAPNQTKMEQLVRRADLNSTSSVVNFSSAVSAGTAVNLPGEELVKLGPLRGYLVAVKNDTAHPLIFDGDKASANSNGQQLRLASLSEVSNVAMPKKRFVARLVDSTAATIVGGASIGAAAAVEDSISNGSSITGRYGADEARRTDEQSRFGKRVLFPGETSTGVIYFKTVKQSNDAKLADNDKTKVSSALPSITIPVSPLYDNNDEDAMVP